ncbi:MAG: tetratricopeptide repeat protein [Planctomycetota bacterium]
MNESSSPSPSPILPNRLVGCRLLAATLAFAFLTASASSPLATAADSTEESIALYADAANFQTSGAIDLAIQNWKQFLDEYPDDDLASKAAHYLGVCYMQSERPDYAAAADAFALALKDKEYDLREESLANQGWCYYAAAGDGPDRDESRLRQTMKAFEQLRKENPRSDYIDRAYFYSGEAAYGLGDRKQAISLYNKFLKLPIAAKSPLRCDAIYARGIAQEELKQVGAAIDSYEELLSSCGDSPLATDVNLRLGDLRIMEGDFKRAITAFGRVLDMADDEKMTSDDDVSYAIFRQAYALVQSGDPGQAAIRYDRLQREFPQSPYAAGATLASGQSLYRDGKIDEAAKRFERVLQQNDAASATEAAHWLVRIALSKGDAESAATIARQQLARDVAGDYAIDLKVDLAEALSLNPKTIAESIEIGEAAFKEAPEDALAPRALYNAAFSALQLGQNEKAGELATTFLSRFRSDPLAADVQFIEAESQLMRGQVEAASKIYQSLLRSADRDALQRPLWALRAALTLNRLRKPEDAIRVLKSEYKSFAQPAQRAEAQFLVGQAHLQASRAGDAAVSFGRAVSADPNWPRRSEAMLLRGTAALADGQTDVAKETWTQMLSSKADEAMADQARYKLAQLASSNGQHADAVRYYEQILSSRRDPGLRPYALYGRGWSLMQQENHEAAIEPLSTLLSETPDHPLADDALVARGVSKRATGDLKSARSDLEAFVKGDVTGINLGHALYELALIDQKEDDPTQAAKRLKQLIRDVPGYPAMDKVRYELGWSLRAAGDAGAASKEFEMLLAENPDANYAGDSAYFVGQEAYQREDWTTAAKYFRLAADTTGDDALSEKSLYRLGWSHYKTGELERAENAFAEQSRKHPDRKLAIDARMMVGECLFKQAEYEQALAAYSVGRRQIQRRNEDSKSIRDAAERQVRELILLHGGQSAAQLKRWDEAIGWYEELKDRFPATAYRPQVFYETGFAYQQKGDQESAIQYFNQVAENYLRREIGARARFMMGEIFFGQKQFDKAIPEFKRVMFGFGSEKAPEPIKNWQAKSGFEAGRCSELLVESAKTPSAKNQAREIAKQFYEYVVQKHPKHELAGKAAERLKAL